MRVTNKPVGKIDLTTWNWEAPHAMHEWFMEGLSDVLRFILQSGEVENLIMLELGALSWNSDDYVGTPGFAPQDIVIRLPLGGTDCDYVETKVSLDAMVEEVIDCMRPEDVDDADPAHLARAKALADKFDEYSKTLNAFIGKMQKREER